MIPIYYVETVKKVTIKFILKEKHETDIMGSSRIREILRRNKTINNTEIKKEGFYASESDELQRF